MPENATAMQAKGFLSKRHGSDLQLNTTNIDLSKICPE
jgi:hypothetical protein